MKVNLGCLRFVAELPISSLETRSDRRAPGSVGRLLRLTVCLVIAAGLFADALSAQSPEWAWIGGSSTTPCGSGAGAGGVCGQSGTYGTLGTSAVANVPGGRDSAVGWTDSNGNFWAFGGEGFDSAGTWSILNDLWEFNPSLGQWTWMGGSSIVPGYDQAPPGVYGALGTPDTGNIPMGRENSNAWTDQDGNFWLFGGLIIDTSNDFNDLNDLWEFNPTTGQRTWMGGSQTVSNSCYLDPNYYNFCGQAGVYGTLGSASTSYIPGGRDSSVTWIDKNGNLWLFGGEGEDSAGNFGELNDLWEFNPNPKEWAWIGGSSTIGGVFTSVPGVYGTLGTPADGNTPGGRYAEVGWTDSNGNLWLFGGYGADSAGNYGYLNDLWEFNPTTKQWAWMGGSSTVSTHLGIYGYGSLGVYGHIGVAAAANVPGGREYAQRWTDSAGNFWLSGGIGPDSSSAVGYENDLWEFSPSTKEWTWVGGSSKVGNILNTAGQPGVYGSLGIATAGNTPGGRYSPIGWTDHTGNLWLFGGKGFDSGTTYGELNDLWGYTLTGSLAAVPAVLTTPTPGLGTVLGTSSVNFQWSAGTGVTLYQLNLGVNAPGSSSLFATGGIASTSVTVPTLPANGVTVYARLFSKIDGAWQYNDYVYTEPGSPTPAVLTTPTPGLGTVLGTSGVNFQWSAGTGVTLYQLNLGINAPGSSSLYATGGIASTSVTVPTLPANGVTVYARLFSKISGVWQYNDYVYTEPGSPTPAVLTTPTPGLGTVLGTSSVNFQWSAGTGVTLYQLNLGINAPGSSSLYATGGIDSTSVTVPTLPADGVTIYARLFSKISGAWQYNDYVYTESGSPTPAVLTTPTPGLGTVLGTSGVNFQWSAGTGVTLYQLNLGINGPGSGSLYATGGIASTSVTVPTLPANGVKVYARLFSKIDGVWQYSDYVYTESGP